ncbi:uncharacterized protein G2W53_018316 [Senna tora]|uniref:Uncharacterized protein n=1 Tax=Senna tora TaxID=362788 RepID=A0A834WL91_9FABA|nr:uncharacterized protein G2W53_018316 [Senna tora]
MGVVFDCFEWMFSSNESRRIGTKWRDMARVDGRDERWLRTLFFNHGYNIFFLCESQAVWMRQEWME